MSTKKANVPSIAPAEPTPAAGAASPTPAPLDDLTIEALRRFDPFVFTFATDTKDTVDVSPCIDVVARDPSIAENFFLIDRQEAVNAFCALSVDKVLPPYQGQVYTDVKAMQAVLADVSDGAAALTAAQSALVAACVHQKLSTFAVAREKRRLAVLEAAHQAHLDLVEKYVDDGMSSADAERAAVAEEEAVRAAEAAELAAGDDGAEGEERPQAFVCLKYFPQTALDVASLGKVGIHVASILTVNSNARLGMRKEDPAKAAAAAAAVATGGKGGKAPAAAEAKKADPKKAPAGGAKKGEDLSGAAPVTESVSALLRKELCKMPPFTTQHPFLDIALWDYTAPTVLSNSAAATGTTNGDEGGSAKAYDLVESEMSIFSAMASRVVALELARHRFQAWRRNMVEVVVPPLVLHDAAKEEAEAQAAAAAAAAREKAEALAKTAGGKKAAAPPPKGAKGAAAQDAAAEAASHRDGEVNSLVPPMPPALPPLPTEMTKLRPMPRTAQHDRADDGSLEWQLLDVVDAAACAAADQCGAHPDDSRRASCIGAAEGSSPQPSPRTQANELLEKAVRQAKEDVSDYADYMLGILDGTQLEVCAAIRNRRRMAAGGSVGAGGEAAATAVESSDSSVQLGEDRFAIAGPQTASPACTGGCGATTAQTSAVVSALIAPHQRFEHVESADGADAACVERLIACLRLNNAQLSHDDAARIVASRSNLIEHLSPAELDARLLALHGAMDTDLLSTRVLQCEDGVEVIACGVAAHHVASSSSGGGDGGSNGLSAPPHRSIAFWDAFHGAPTYAQYVQWLDYVEKETLYYHPPPKDEDEDEPEAEDEPAEDEEEEDEEQEDVYDDDGNVVEQPPRKKAKKIVLYDPEYVDVASKEKAARRRRQVLELVGRVLDYQPLLSRKQTVPTRGGGGAPQEDAWPLAACNHSAHMVHEDVDLMYPKDGCTIAVRTSTANEAVVACHVYPPGVPQGRLQFGFERRQAPPTAAALPNHHLNETPAVPTDGTVETRIRTTVGVEGVVATLDVVVEPPEAHEPANGGGAGAEIPPAAQAPLAVAAAAAPAVAGKTPRGGPSKPTAAAASTEAAVATPTPREGHHAVEQQKQQPKARNGPLLHANLTNWDGVSVRLSSASNVVALQPDARLPLGSVTECPSVTVFDGATQSVVRVPVAAEVERSVTDAGVMLITYVAEAAAAVPQRPTQPAHGTTPHHPTPPPSGSPAKDGNVSAAGTIGGGDDARIYVQLFPTGTTAAVYQGHCLVTRPDGVRIVRAVTATGGSETPEPTTGARVLSNISVATWRDDVALRTTQQREDGVVLHVNDATGLNTITFADGTTYEVAPSTASLGGGAASWSWCRIASPRPYPTVAVSTKLHAAAGGSGSSASARREVSVVNRNETVVATLEAGASLRLSSLVTGFHVVVPLAAPHFLHALPTPDSNAAYVVDMLYGGLRVEDDGWCFHVTPQGEARARLAVEEHAPPPTDLTVKHTIEVFGRGDQGLPSDLRRVLEARFGGDSSLLHPLHTLEHVPTLPSTPLLQHALRPTAALVSHRSRHTAADDVNVRATTERLVTLLQPPHTDDAVSPLLSSCRLFVRAADGSGYELLDGRDRAAMLRAILAQADLVRSEVLQGDAATGGAGRFTLACASRSALRGSALSPRDDCGVVANDVRQPPLAARSVEQFARLMRDLSSHNPLAHAGASALPTLALHTYARDLTTVSLEGAARTSDARWVEEQLQQRLPIAAQAAVGTGHEQAPRRLPTTADAKLGQRAVMGSAVAALHGELCNLQQSHASWWAYPHATHSTGTPGGNTTATDAKEQQVVHPKGPSTRGTSTTLRGGDDPTVDAASPAPTAKHVNPAASTMPPPPPSATPAAPLGAAAAGASSRLRSLTAHRLVATPTGIDFGTLMEGFRYTSSVQLTNIATASCRYRVELPASCAAWLSVEYPKVPIAAGMSVTLTFEVSGHQSPGPADVDVVVVHEGGGRASIPLALMTRSSDERPVSQQRRGVRMVGPSPILYHSTTSAVTQ